MPNSSYRKKLIEVALPLETINRKSAREKSIRHGHPSTLHFWWARRPLAACRAVLFASRVDDPASCPDEFPTDEAQDRKRQRLSAHRGAGEVGKLDQRVRARRGARRDPEEHRRQ
jgi:putative DNA methylase